jgi:hypothetical protein
MEKFQGKREKFLENTKITYIKKENKVAIKKYRPAGDPKNKRRMRRVDADAIDLPPAKPKYVIENLRIHIKAKLLKKI